MKPMPRPIARLPLQLPSGTRKVDRQPASGAVLVHSSRGDHAAKRLRDISPHGCNLIGDAPWLRMGMFVTIRISADRSLQAIVRWVRGATCGVEFLRPIPLAEADMIAELIGNASQSNP